MEIKISDMMDQTAECNETLTSAGTEVDFDKVKQSVMKKAQTKPVHKKSIFFYARTAAAVFAVVLVVTGTTVIAKGLLPLGGLVTKDNEKDISEEQICVSEEIVDPSTSEITDWPGQDAEPDSSVWYFNPYDLNEDGIGLEDMFTFTYAVQNDQYLIPTFYLDSGAFAELRDATGDGLHFAKGQKITISFQQRSAFEGSEAGNPSASIGYLVNGNFTCLEHIRDKEGVISFIAPETGNYVISFADCGSDRTVYENVTVTSSK